jgi:ABC-type glutathione transport system ATPase component
VSALLSFRRVTRRFPAGRLGEPRAAGVEEVSFELARTDALALVGESGAGKSTLARLAAGLLSPSEGEVLLEGRPPAAWAPKERARRVQLVFQDPSAAVDPRMRAEAILAEPLEIHGEREVGRRVEALFAEVQLSLELRRSYPHQLSGGQLGRLGLARALALEPALLVLDEPFSGLDRSIGAQIAGILAARRARAGTTILLVTHDLAAASRLASSLAVLHAGRLVEHGPTDSVLGAPQHPATKRLVSRLAPG